MFRLPYTKPCLISDRATQLSSPPPPLSAHPPFTTPDNHPPTSAQANLPSLQFHPPSLRMIGSIGALSREKGPALHIPCDQTILLTSYPINSAADPPHPITLVLPHRSRFCLGRHQKIPLPRLSPPALYATMHVRGRTIMCGFCFPSPADLHPVSSPSSPAAPPSESTLRLAPALGLPLAGTCSASGAPGTGGTKRTLWASYRRVSVQRYPEYTLACATRPCCVRPLVIALWRRQA